jgi:hypothetical protein
VEYFSSGIAPYYILNDEISDRAAGFFSCVHDLDECKKYLDALEGVLGNAGVSETIKKALYVSAVVIYMKCYNSGKGRFVQLDYTIVFIDHDDFLKEHKRVKDIRNKCFGHRGGGTREYNKTIVYFNPARVDFDNIVTKVSVTVFSFAHNIEIFRQLIATSRSFIQQQLGLLLPQFQAAVRSEAISEMYSKSKIPDPGKFI